MKKKKKLVRIKTKILFKKEYHNTVHNACPSYNRNKHISVQQYNDV